MHKLENDLILQAEALLETSAPKGRIWWQSKAKETTDRILAASMAGPSSIAISLLAACVLIADKNYPFINVGHSQLGGRWTNKWKVQTMYSGAHEEESAISGGRTISEMKARQDWQDPRVTKIGRYIRRSGLDELPQIFDAMLGNHALIGPRLPSRTESQSCFHNELEPFKEFSGYLNEGLKFGLFSLSVLISRHVPLKERIAIENIYGRSASFKGDLKILALTLPATLKMPGK